MNRKIAFFEGWSLFKFNNLRLTLVTNLQFYTSVAKGLKLKVTKFWGLTPMFVEVTEGKLVGGGRGAFWVPHTEIGSREKILFSFCFSVISISNPCPDSNFTFTF